MHAAEGWTLAFQKAPTTMKIKTPRAIATARLPASIPKRPRRAPSLPPSRLTREERVMTQWRRARTRGRALLPRRCSCGWGAKTVMYRLRRLRYRKARTLAPPMRLQICFMCVRACACTRVRVRIWVCVCVFACASV